MTTVAAALAGLAAERATASVQPGKDAKAKFRSSIGWRRTRYAVLAESAAKNGGTARCELCGVAAAPGKPLHVDHIAPVGKSWARRFDRANLQVLCADCNVGKLDGAARDFRTGDRA